MALGHAPTFLPPGLFSCSRLTNHKGSSSFPEFMSSRFFPSLSLACGYAALSPPPFSVSFTGSKSDPILLSCQNSFPCLISGFLPASLLASPPRHPVLRYDRCSDAILSSCDLCVLCGRFPAFSCSWLRLAVCPPHVPQPLSPCVDLGPRRQRRPYAAILVNASAFLPPHTAKPPANPHPAGRSPLLQVSNRPRSCTDPGQSS